MSFDFNMTPSSFKPKVENTFLGKGGGGGNTGYFRQEKKKKDEDNSIMSKMLSEDVLDKVSDKMPEFEEESGLMDKIKGLFSKFS